jgi:hypothetical protein
VPRAPVRVADVICYMYICVQKMVTTYDAFVVNLRNIVMQIIIIIG